MTARRAMLACCLLVAALGIGSPPSVAGGADEPAAPAPEAAASESPKTKESPASERRRPQEPQPPFPYVEEEVTYEDKASAMKYAGTLTRPKESGPFPAVLLISGSGAQDRNSELLGHKPFLVWADYLTRRGVAVLRVDDRGVGGTSGTPGNSTIEDHARDALAGVAYLKSRADIDPRRIGLMGHSEGGVVAPAAAAQSADVAFIVMLAGTGVIGEDIIYSQSALIGAANGLSPELLGQNLASQKLLLSAIKATDGATPYLQGFVRILQATNDRLPAEDRLALDSLGQMQLPFLFSPWFRHFLTYDPAPALTKVKCPVLAICGEKDLQVEPKLNLPKIDAALKAGGNADFTVNELPGLNHLFQKCETGAPAEYAKIEETINPAVLALVGDWLEARIKPKGVAPVTDRTNESSCGP